MSKYTDDELYQLLTETGRLLRGVKPQEGEEYSLESILAEFGQETARPAQNPTEPQQETPEQPPEEPERQSAPHEQEKPAPVPEDPALLDTQRLRRTVAANMAKVMGPEKRADGSPLPPRPAAPVREERPSTPEKPVLQVVEGGKSEPPGETHSEVFPEEPEGMHKVPLEKVMSQTVESVLDDDDAILEPAVPLRERLQDLLDVWGDRLSDLFSKKKKTGTDAAWEQPDEVPKREEPEPDMEQAAREENGCARSCTGR